MRWPPRPGSLRERLLQRRSALAPVGDETAAGWRGRLVRDPFPLPTGAWVERDVAYGEHPSQRLDVYRPASQDTPLIVLMVHGGGWQTGSKDHQPVVRHKAQRWVARGWTLVSINYRLLPEAGPLEQADDVARALAFVQRQAGGWGGDSGAVVLVGHSAGGHLVSLLGADPAIGQAHGVGPWRASIVLDSVALDVEQLMQFPHLPPHDAAFGADPASWRQVSPMHRLAGALAAPMLIVCSAHRGAACRVAEAFARRALDLGGQVEVMAVDLSHREINDQLGLPGPFTDGVEAFIDRAR